MVSKQCFDERNQSVDVKAVLIEPVSAVSSEKPC